MNIKRDLTSLPSADPVPEDRVVGMPPTRQPTIGPKLAEAWFEARTHDDNLARAIPDAGPFRGSDAGKCSRQLWYRLNDVAKTEPPTIADHWRMDLGIMVHEALQEVIESITLGAINELQLDLNVIGIPGSMHMDILNPVRTFTDRGGNEQTEYEAVEIKTVNGFGYKSMATDFKRSGPEGPRESHIMQACIGAAAADSTGFRVVGARVVYLSMELVSPQLAANIGLGGEEARFTAEWFFPIKQCYEVAEMEGIRWRHVLRAYEAGDSVNGMIPTAAGKPDLLTVVNPKTGAGVDLEGKGGKTWMCNYCSYQSQCIHDHEVQAD